MQQFTLTLNSTSKILGVRFYPQQLWEVYPEFTPQKNADKVIARRPGRGWWIKPRIFPMENLLGIVPSPKGWSFLISFKHWVKSQIQYPAASSRYPYRGYRWELWTAIEWLHLDAKMSNGVGFLPISFSMAFCIFCYSSSRPEHKCMMNAMIGTSRPCWRKWLMGRQWMKTGRMLQDCLRTDCFWCGFRRLHTRWYTKDWLLYIVQYII